MTRRSYENIGQGEPRITLKTRLDAPTAPKLEQNPPRPEIGSRSGMEMSNRTTNRRVARQGVTTNRTHRTNRGGGCGEREGIGKWKGKRGSRAEDGGSEPRNTRNRRRGGAGEGKPRMEAADAPRLEQMPASLGIGNRAGKETTNRTTNRRVVQRSEPRITRKTRMAAATELRLEQKPARPEIGNSSE